jgi:cell filamentation protein
VYQASRDPYVYKGTDVLRNRLGIRMQIDLLEFEIDATAARFSEPFPTGRFSTSHYRAMHRHIFGDVYRWAGLYRNVRIAKGGSMFCYPEHIPAEMRRLFGALQAGMRLKGLGADEFSLAGAQFLAELNAIHPFRDGNGRTQLAFMSQLAEFAGHPLLLERLEPESFLAAVIQSFHGRNQPLADALLELVAPPVGGMPLTLP